MKFKIGDVVETTDGSDVDLPIGSIGTVIQTDEKDYLYPYQIESCGGWYWCSESDLAPISERSEEKDMPKQKDLYDFENMSDDDLDRLICEANEALKYRKTGRVLEYLDDAINTLVKVANFDCDTITSNGNDILDIINELKQLKTYYI